MSKKTMNRRKFLGAASCAAVGTTTMLSSLSSLGMISALAKPRPLLAGAPPAGTYKAMVCILLAGGNDSFNMLVPTTNETYNVYANTRSNLALPQGDLLGLNYTDSQGYNYGVHPSMPEVQTLFNDGKLAFVSNIGTLIEPTTKTQILNETASLPLGLLSHADQIRHWQTSLPQSRSAEGWGGRMADIIDVLNENQDVSMSISLGGTNVWQAGQSVEEFAITTSGNGSVGIEVLEGGDFLAQVIGDGVQSLLAQEYQDIFKKTYSNKVNSAQSQHTQFSQAIAEVSPFATTFSPNPLSQQLHMVAKSIAASGTLQMNRQTYFVQLGGWDHHDEILNAQTTMLAIVSQALSEFNAALEEIAMSECVTTFTISDFARTLTSNGNGTDHAWGGNCMVMGGSVNGGQVYGSYPGLDLNSDLEIGGGVLIPSTSTDEYFAELAMWYGIDDSNLLDILPNLSNFYNIGSGNPLGFLNF